MKLPLFVTATCVLALVVTEGSAFAAEDVVPARDTVTLTLADSGKTVKLAVGKSICLSLDANPTTGYLWTVVKQDTKVLALKGKPRFKPTSKKLGAPQRQIFRFNGLAAGKSKLKLHYVRPFEQDRKPAREFEVTVDVEAAKQ